MFYRSEVLKRKVGRPIPPDIVSATLFLSLALSVSGKPTPQLEAQLRLEDPRVYELVRRRGRLAPEEALEWAVAIEAEAKRNDLPVSLVLGVIKVESAFRPRARSVVGAIGLMQVMPSTGRELARQLGIPWRGRRTLQDPLTSIRMGTAYVRRMLDFFGGRRNLALAAYCHGPGVIQRYQRAGHVPARRLRYARKVWRAEQVILRQLERIGRRDLVMAGSMGAPRLAQR